MRPTQKHSWKYGLQITEGANRDKINISAKRIMINGYGFKDIDVVCDLSLLGEGGLDVGSQAINTFYSLYLITDPAGTHVSAMFSTNHVAPTYGKAKDYAQSLRVGCFFNNSAGDLYRFWHRSDGWISFNEDINAGPFRIIAGGVSTAYSPISVAGIVPPVATDVEIAAYGITTAVGNLVAYIRPTGSNWASGSHTEILRAFSVGTADASGNRKFPIGTDRSIDWHGANVNNSITLDVIGYFDPASVSG